MASLATMSAKLQPYQFPFLMRRFYKVAMLYFVVLSLLSYGESSAVADCNGENTGTACKTEDVEGICVFMQCVTTLAPDMQLKIVVKYPERHR